LPGGPVHPGLEGGVAGVEGEPAKQRLRVGSAVEELLGPQLDRPVDLLHDHPSHRLPAEPASFDHLSGEPEAPQAGPDLVDAAAPDGQFHQYWWRGVIPSVRYSPEEAAGRPAAGGADLLWWSRDDRSW